MLTVQSAAAQATLGTTMKRFLHYPEVQGRFVTRRDLPELAREVREAQGLSPQEAAHAMGVPADVIEKAEAWPYRALFKFRRRLLERYTGYTLDGPYYRLRPKE